MAWSASWSSPLVSSTSDTKDARSPGTRVSSACAKSRIMATKPSTALPILPDTMPAFAACAKAEMSGMPFDTAYASILRTLVSPMPRVGVLMMRRSETSSRGFAHTRRYAIASLISLRS